MAEMICRQMINRPWTATLMMAEIIRPMRSQMAEMICRQTITHQ